MPLEFTLRAPNIEGFRLAARRIVLQDYRRLWPYAASVLTNMWINIFNTQGASGTHGAWAELSDDYAKRKAKKYPGQPILKASGKLFTAGLSPAAFVYEPRSMRFEVNVSSKTGAPYAFYHQTGFRTRLGTGRSQKAESRRQKAGTKKAFVEARRTIDPTERDRQAIQRALASGYIRILRKMGYKIAGERGVSITPAEAVGLGREFFMSGGTPLEAAL